MSSPKIPYRQIRAHYTDTRVTVYQAYNSTIAEAAVEHQKLNASSKFSTTRMTWIKPSWAWMLYRAGYSYKDKGQERILALTMTHESFKTLLRKAVLTHGDESTDSGAKVKKEGREKPASVRVQWDPERNIKLDKLNYRSIQIGVPGALVDELVEGIVQIEDVTERARELKTILDGDKNVSMEELAERGLIPDGRPFDVDEGLTAILKMNENEQADAALK